MGFYVPDRGSMKARFLTSAKSANLARQAIVDKSVTTLSGKSSVAAELFKAAFPAAAAAAGVRQEA